jgi:hypothetical protein
MNDTLRAVLSKAAVVMASAGRTRVSALHGLVSRYCPYPLVLRGG